MLISRNSIVKLYDALNVLRARGGGSVKFAYNSAELVRTLMPETVAIVAAQSKLFSEAYKSYRLERARLTLTHEGAALAAAQAALDAEHAGMLEQFDRDQAFVNERMHAQVEVPIDEFGLTREDLPEHTAADLEGLVPVLQ